MSLESPRDEILPELIVIRADASPVIGAGHIIRCLTISKELSTFGFECLFLQDYIALDWVRNQILDSGFMLKSLVDLAQMNLHKPTLLIDSYQISSQDVELTSFRWSQIIEIVDPSTPVLPASMYISPNPYPDQRLSQTNMPVLEGIEFIPVRDHFLQPEKSEDLAEKSRINFLISGGGTNLNNFVEAVCFQMRNLDLDFRATALTSNREIPNWHDNRFSICELGNLDSLDLSNFEIFLTTSGQSAWEFLAVGKLMAVACGIENQYGNYKFLVESGAASDLGNFHLGTWHLREESFGELLNQSNILAQKEFQRRNTGFGLGSRRIAEEIMKLIVS